MVVDQLAHDFNDKLFIYLNIGCSNSLNIMKIFLLISCILCIIKQNVDTTMIEKLTVQQLISHDWSIKNDANKVKEKYDLAPVEMDQKLMDI